MTGGTAAYTERYRWTPAICILVTGCLAFIALMVVARLPLILEVPVIGVFGWFALYSVATVISRKVAFRVDERGVTLGGGPFRYRSTSRFFAWEDIETITLWQRYLPFTIGRWTLFTLGPVRYIGLQRHTGARPITQGRRGRADRQAYAAPVAGIVAGAARNITAWVLDHDRLAEAVAAYAPAVRIQTERTAAKPRSSP